MKETEGYIEKDRTFRNRNKKKRLTVEEKREQTNDLKPKHQPYHRKKDWMQLPYEDGTTTYHGRTYPQYAPEDISYDNYDNEEIP